MSLNLLGSTVWRWDQKVAGMIELTEIRSFGEGKSNVRLWSRLGFFCRNKERSVRESFANVKRILACSCGPKRRKT